MSYGSRRIRDYSRASGFVQKVPIIPDGSLIWPAYFGTLPTNTLPTPTQVLVMTRQAMALMPNTSFQYSNATGLYLFINLPKYFGPINTFSGPITAWTLLTPMPVFSTVNGVLQSTTATQATDVPLEVNVNSPETGNQPILIEYNVWVSNTTSTTASPLITIS